jgi:hypothetical protein
MIMQVPNTGWLVTAAKVFAGFLGQLLSPAKDKIYKIIYFIQKGSVQEYPGAISAV